MMPPLICLSERELIDDQPAVVDAENFLHRDQAGLGVHFDFGELHAARRIGGKPFNPLA